jgi:hypothetical protein
MKSYKNKIEQFVEFLEPPVEKDSPKFDLRNVFTIYNQEKFNRYISKIAFDVQGEITDEEEKILRNIKDEIKQLQKKFSDVKPERLEFDLAKIFHSNLRQIGFGRFHVDDVGMWRWMSMNYFKEETFWRRAKADFEKGDYSVKPAKATFEHCVGKRSRDIFPRRYFVLGQRLFDENEKYTLIEKLAEKSRAARAGGFGNLIANLVETKLISPNDYVSKVVSKVMFTETKIGDDKEVRYAFVRYNAYRKRLLNNAAENVFKNEICLMAE